MYRLVVEYDGTGFCGAQYLPDQRTVAGTLESALSRLFESPIKLTIAGRTDAGVHALGQVVSFRGRADFPVERLAIATNSQLPNDVSVRDASRVADDFSARFSAFERRYAYLVLARAAPCAPFRRFAHFEYRELDLEGLREAARTLVGEHDFASFCADPPLRGGTVRTIRAFEIERDADLVRFRLRGNGFLHRMVRIVVGTLLEIGTGRRHLAELPAILAARDRRVAGPTAPPQGLFLTGVSYPGFESDGTFGSLFAASPQPSTGAPD
ncbi:MAG: tRNA pseudouridine(38-40) synthase TruA [Candidatus Baltobacteraceae bacterium]